ncbi:MAG: hypothetical protein M0P69_20910, partial [Bacteroidales bacterium]|nr:hypothetical protein [Bacteroidales bacterium]
ELESIVDEYHALGYSVKSTETSATATKPGGNGSLLGHLIVFVFLGWWLFLLPNLGYLIYSRSAGKDEVLIKVGAGE